MSRHGSVSLSDTITVPVAPDIGSGLIPPPPTHPAADELATVLAQIDWLHPLVHPHVRTLGDVRVEPQVRLLMARQLARAGGVANPPVLPPRRRANLGRLAGPIVLIATLLYLTPWWMAAWLTLEGYRWIVLRHQHVALAVLVALGIGRIWGVWALGHLFGWT